MRLAENLNWKGLMLSIKYNSLDEHQIIPKKLKNMTNFTVQNSS
jgi:hypothetical protein